MVFQRHFHTAFFSSEILCLLYQPVPEKKAPKPHSLLICHIDFILRSIDSLLIWDKCRCSLILKIPVILDKEVVNILST